MILVNLTKTNILINYYLNFMKKTRLFIFLITLSALISLQACNKNVMDPNRPTSAEDKRRKNIEEGRGASIGGLLGNVGKTNYEFSSSNPMWRASLETLDFLPLTTVDYSGGAIITDWYSNSDNDSSDQIKITIRFLSNEIRSDSLKIIVHRKTCFDNNNCKTILSNSSVIKDELRATILRRASLLEKSDKEKK